MPPRDHDRGAGWRQAIVAGLLLAAVAGLWLAHRGWAAGRPERHLAEADRLLAAGEPAEALAWLDLPEETPRTREAALLIRARAALARNRPADAVAPLDAIDPGGPLGA